MNAIKTVLSAYMKVHQKVAWPVGIGLVVVLVGIAVYAKWIQPEAEFDKIVDTSSTPVVVNLGILFVLFLILAPALWHCLQIVFFILLSPLMNPLVMAPLAFLQWIFLTIRDALRKRRSP